MYNVVYADVDDNDDPVEIDDYNDKVGDEVNVGVDNNFFITVWYHVLEYVCTYTRYICVAIV